MSTRTTAELFRTLLDRSSDLIEIYDADTGRLVDANQRACERLGYQRDELLALSVPDLYPEVDETVFRRYVEQLLIDTELQWEGAHRARDGSVFPVEANISLVVIDGRAHAVAIVRDVTARRSTEAELERSRLTLEQISSSVVITDKTGRIEYVNAAFERMSGYTRAEVCGKNPRILQSGTQSPEFYRAMWDTLARGESWTAMFVNRRRDGSLYHQQTTISPLKDRSGTVSHYVGIGRDVSRELGLEAKLAQALRYTQTVLDSSALGIITYRASGDAISANPAAAAMVGATVERLEAQNFRTIESWQRAGLCEVAERALSTGRPQQIDAEVHTTFGRAVWMRSQFIPFRFDGEPQLLAMFTDLTEHKRLEAQFAQAQKMEAMGLLAGGIAHDFNNMLSVILSFGGFARDALPEGDERRNDIIEALKAADRAAGLTRQLLTFSRRKATEKRPTDLNQSLAQLAKLLARSVEENIRLTVSPSPRPITVEIDPVQFDQVILNLVLNARDAMPDGGSLHVALDQVDGTGPEGTCPRARLTVADTGMGMDANTLEHIFEPFFTTKEQGKGTGLGLATCYGVINAAGGTIQVTSAVGKGTTFTIDLPVTGETRDVVRASQTIALHGNRQRVLVIEDEPALRQATVRVLENAGYLVSTASNGEDALPMIDELGAELDVIVSDVVMPGCSGHYIARYAARAVPGVQVVLTSGYFDEAARRDQGDHLPILWKPVAPEDLLHAVAVACNTRRTLRSSSRDVPVEGSLADNDRPPPDTNGHAPSPPTIEAVAPRRTRARPTHGPSVAPERVLLVEDDDVLVRTTSRMLSRSGFDVVVAGTLAAATELLDRGGFDVMVSDINLPDGNALDLVGSLRAKHVELPVLMMTGAPSIDSAALAVQYRVNEYLQKPVGADRLRVALRSAIDQGRTSGLRTKLLASRFGHDELLRDLPGTEARFAAAMRSLHMAYQPIVRAADSSIYGFEALLRCDEPTLESAHKLLSAAEFLGRIDEVGRAVRSQVATTILGHQDRVESIFVNVHPSEFRADLLAETVDRLLPLARRVVLEVTEQTSVATGPELDATLDAIRSLGYRIAIDDLGEGYAGLSSLIHLSPDFVKIDMSLVQNIHRAPIKQDIIGAIVDISRRSGISVIAEGVETETERATLIDLGCDLLQGYLFAKPGPAFPTARSEFAPAAKA